MKMSSNSKVYKSLVLLAFTFVCISFAFSFLIIKDFSSPLSGMTGLGPWPNINHDFVDVQEYNGFYFAKNLYFNPFPHLNLINNQVFYPYGINSIFNPWSIEKDLFYAVLYSFFGSGPWLQIYYLMTVLVTATGTFILLKRDYGFARASGAGFLVSFGNFYAINKYPHHLQYSVIHWSILSLIADFLIVKRVVLKQKVSLKLILVRSCLLFLTFGHDLGYIAGFGLMSFTISALFIAVLICYRRFRGELKIIKLLRTGIETYKNDFFASPRTCLALLGLIIIAAYIYLPLVIQIATTAKSFDFTGISFGDYWTNPFRLLIPFFPIIINPGRTLEKVFHDSPEAIGTGSPGWFLLILGTIGLWQNRNKITIFVPLLIIFILCLLYIPGVLPTLKIFPWFAFNRVQGRCTVIYPAILCIFALHTDFNWLSLPRKQALAGLLVILACTEIGTAYSFRFGYEQPKLLNQNFFTYMNYVKQQPGEAVLDWPFCIASGGGPDNICPYYNYNSGIFALRRFHEKKVMGQYFGRLHHSQVVPYFQAGWQKLFFPDSNTPSRQKRCFKQAEWSFFTDFYKLNDFAGINLYVDRLPKDCVTEFYTRFGYPAVETLVPEAGVVKFIPKSSELRNQVNLALGANLKFQPLLDLSESNLIKVSSPYSLTTSGLSDITNYQQSWYFRWGMNPETVLSFALSEPQALKLTFRFESFIGLYDVSLEINGETIDNFSKTVMGSSVNRNIEFQGIKGTNKIIFRYKKNKSFLDIFNDLITSIKSQGISAINVDYLNKIYGFWKNDVAIQFRDLSISKSDS